MKLFPRWDEDKDVVRDDFDPPVGPFTVIRPNGTTTVFRTLIGAFDYAWTLQDTTTVSSPTAAGSTWATTIITPSSAQTYPTFPIQGK